MRRRANSRSKLQRHFTSAAVRPLHSWTFNACAADLEAKMQADAQAAAALLDAFRLRFRPMAQGPLDAIDCALAAGLRELRDASRAGI